MKKVLCALALLVCLFALGGCGGMADISAYGDIPITISGLTEEEFTVTPNELAELDCVSRTATGATEKAGTVQVVGPLLNTFLAQYDCQASDFERIRFLCKDGYKVVLRDEYLSDYELVLAVSGNKEALSEDVQPLRLLIPEAESGKWAYGITRIEFVRE